MKLKYFKLSDFNCTHTGKNEMEEDFLLRLDELRDRCGFPFFITSGYRDITHPVEAKKEVGGQHTKGVAADIMVINGYQRYTILKEALAMGFKGIGVANSFIHVDDRVGKSVTSWSY